MLYNAKEAKLILDDVQMDYITFGNGIRPLIMIQGLNTRDIKGAALPLAYMYRIFAKEYKVYLFDRRKNIAGDITVKDIAADIAKAMDELKISNADVFGTSQGGMIAQYLAIDRPDLVRKMVLAVTLSRNNPTVETAIEKWLFLTEQGNFKELIKDMTYLMYSDNYVKRYKTFLPLLTVLQKPKDIQRFKILSKACLTCQTYDELDKIKCPVFVIGGKQDKVTSAAASEEIAQKLGCKLYMYENLGHSAYEEAKDFNKRVYDFLKD